MELLARTRDRWVSLSPVQREIVIFAIALLIGLFLVPALIWIIGTLVLGPYADGGWIALLADFLAGLAHGSLVFWAVALGPYLVLVLLRVFITLWRRSA